MYISVAWSSKLAEAERCAAGFITSLFSLATDA